MADGHVKQKRTPYQDLSGQRFTRLLVVCRAPDPPDRSRAVRWRCRCDCGKETIVIGQALKKGMSRSCGCLCRDVNRKHGYTVGGKYIPEYDIWRQMIARCHDERHASYPNYGGRGIRVCRKWRESYEAFIAHVGARPTSKHTLDRIDNHGDYEPGNCRWVTRTVQCRNKRNNHLLTFGGQTMCLQEWAERLGIASATLRRRLALGWSVKETLTTPLRAQPATNCTSNT